MTIKELKDYYFNTLKINLKPKISISDNYEITKEGIKKGNVFQNYVSGNTLAKIVNGFTLINNEIFYVYTKIHRIEILSDDFFPPCGGKSEIMVNAVYSIRALNTSGTDIIFNGNDSLLCPINALIAVNNDLFTYEKPYLVNYIPNNSNINNEVIVTASYYHKGIKYEASKAIIQYINSNSSWLVEEEPTQFISVTLSENEVSNKGGIITAKVERYFTRIYYMKDSCGNKISGKSEPDLVEDITKKCLITSSNKKLYTVNKNIITIPKQPIGALKRECTITARYLDKTATSVITQKEGGKISYKHELSFLDGSKVQFVNLETSLPTEKKIHIISKEYKYIDGEYDSVSNTNEFKITSDSDWVYGIQGEDEQGINIAIRTTSVNTDRNNDREAVLTIISAENHELSIKLIVSQQSLEIIKEDYYCDFISSGEFTSEEIDNANLYFHPYKIITYENGDTEKTILDSFITYKYTFHSSNDKLFKITSINKKGNDYFLNFINSSSHSAKDIFVDVKMIFYGINNEKLFESDKASFVIKSNQIVDYNYELCFDGHNKFEKVKWVNSVEPKYIKVNSVKHKMINGKYSGKEQTPFKVGIYDKNGKEYFDNSFSIKMFNDEILVFPVKTESSISNIYTITQKETGDKISFSLEYQIKKSTFNIPLEVIVYSDNIGKDIWTGENGYLLIDNNESIKLNPCWLSPNMKDNIDIAYNGNIELSEGLHTFETFNVICLDNEAKTHKDCNIFKEIKIDKTTKNIILQIKI